MRGLAKALVIPIALLIPAAAARADTIILANTGVDAAGLPLPDGTPDPHYRLISAPDPALTTAFASDFNPGYVANNDVSKWIVPDPAVSPPGGVYVYQTTFDLTGLDPTTAVLTGNIASDNDSEIFLNGASTGVTVPFDAFGEFTPFMISSGFLPGLNTIEFRVNEPGDSPTGLRVEIAGTANPVASHPVPAPPGVVMAAIGGLLGVVGARGGGAGPLCPHDQRSRRLSPQQRADLAADGFDHRF